MYELSEYYEFGTCRGENIQDRIFVGILDKDLSQKLQLTNDLMLSLTMEIVSLTEEVASQINMQGEAAGVIHEVTHKHKYTGHQGKKKEGNKEQWMRIAKLEHELVTHAISLDTGADCVGKGSQWVRSQSKQPQLTFSRGCE